MKEQKILITGGTGKTGRRVAGKLQQAGIINIRIGSRRETPPFDWDAPGSWEEVLTGIDTVYISFQPDLAIPTSASVIRAFTSLASRLGVRKMVLLSGRGEAEAIKCEEIVKEAAASWSIVRASWFNQNFDEGIFLDPILAGHFVVPGVESPEPFTDADDISDVVVQCLLDDKHNGKTYDLTGPELLTFGAAIKQIAEASGRTIVFEPIPMDDYEQMLRSYNVPEDQLWLIRYLFTEVLDGRNANVTNDIEKVLGRKARTFSQYAADAVKKGVWTPSKIPTL
ncbi:NmrA family transcriptional regulator [Chryseolinea sp. T2]|uniref:NmrA family transcriptional regulator n=1 Tax=Chryseolinea sp. T2 TaxID=3129255 RepID=UPI0030774555